MECVVKNTKKAQKFVDAEKAWQILEIAMEDLAMCEKNKKYRIDMSEWYRSNGACTVCMAGAVIAGRLVDNRHGGPSRHGGLSPMNFPDIISMKLSAINNLRTGDVDEAAYKMGSIGDDEAQWPDLRLDRQVADYDEDKRQWWKDMEKLLADLKKANI